MSNYKLCDCCKKIKKDEDLEEVTITFRKCKDCDISSLSISDIASTGIRPVNSRIDAAERMKHLPPPHLREAFSPPPGMESDKVAEIVSRPVNNK